MHSTSVRDTIDPAFPEVSLSASIQAPGTGSSVGGRGSSIDGAPPPPREKPVASELTPSLAAPRAFDAMELVYKLLELQMKMSDGQVATEIENVKARGEMVKNASAEIAKKTREAAEKLEDSKDSAKAGKILGWIGVALTVVAAPFTGPIAAVIAVGLTVTMATLNETGVMDKLTQAIAESLINTSGWSEDEAQRWAPIFTAAIGIGVSLSAAGVGLISTAGVAMRSVGNTNNLLYFFKQSDKIVQIGQHVATVSRVAGAASSAAEASTGIVGGVYQQQAANVQADAADIRKDIARLNYLQGDAMEHIERMLTHTQLMTQKVIEVLEEQNKTTLIAVGRHFG